PRLGDPPWQRTTDRDGHAHAAHPDGRIAILCPGRHPVDDPREGDPVWCLSCRVAIVAAIGRLPDLAADLWDAGAPDTPDPWRTVTRTRAAVNGWVIDVLDCHHTITRPLGPAPLLARCGRCAYTTPGSGGRLAPAEVGDGSRHGTRTGSPSGSPAWDAIDELVAWACTTEDKLRARLHHSAPGDWWDGSTEHRARRLSTAVHYLTHWSEQLLASPEARQVGKDATRLTRRAEQAAGIDRLTHRLPGACMVCDARNSLRRDDGDELVKCRACRAVWHWDYYQLLAKAYADSHGQETA
ncbi:hypothetical protein, partial [Segeticoccus rhizosphaerae]|uniref:hypothetical protein n=1 Tax=Segeticoccus rhizosphaerae TaxID=1104777 RepID=UPI0013968FBA